MLIRFDQKILEYRDVVLNFLSNQSNTLSEQITSFFNGIFDKLGAFLTDFSVKFTAFFDSIINWINTMAVEYFVKFVEPVLILFMNLMIDLFKSIGQGLLKIPGSFVGFLLEIGVPGWARLFFSDDDWSSFKRAMGNAANSIFNPVAELIKQIPSLGI